MSAEKSQLDRIEAKLDQVLVFRDAMLKLALPRLPAGARETAMKLMVKADR